VSPRLPSPRTTPRGSLVPSPRKPSEALPATLTLQQHQKMESMLNRIDTLEAMVTRTLAENRRLQTELTSVKRACNNSDVCEGGGEGVSASAATLAVPYYMEGGGGAGGTADVVAEECSTSSAAGAPAAETCASQQGADAAKRANRAIKFRDEANRTNSGTNSAQVQEKADGTLSFLKLLLEEEADTPPAHAAAVAGGAAERGAAHEEAAEAEAEAEAEHGKVSDEGERAVFQLSDIWEVTPGDITRTSCIGRGACGTVWVGEWRRSKGRHAQNPAISLSLLLACVADV
jgi:hypothetical protein